MTEEQRQSIFSDLVAVQDATLPSAQDISAAIRDSRAYIAGRHNISINDVREIEREGLDAVWPPLAE